MRHRVRYLSTVLAAAIPLSISAAQYSWQQPHAKVLPHGDLEWAPEAFVYTPGDSIRYIDYEHGDDANDGLGRDTAWKHHPWDLSAKGNAAACEGIHTYVFKRGVVYRGQLRADESGEPGNPIRLTSDPSWGSTEAMFFGSKRVTGGWERCSAGTVPEGMPEPEKVWRLKLQAGHEPHSMWVLEGEEAQRVVMAREPDWTVTNWRDPMQDWWYRRPEVMDPWRIGEWEGSGLTGWDELGQKKKHQAEGKKHPQERIFLRRIRMSHILFPSITGIPHTSLLIS